MTGHTPWSEIKHKRDQPPVLTEVWPCTIVKTRYGGTYEPGVWVAFFMDATQLPEDWNGDDMSCMAFWGEIARDGVGAGDTPTAAYEALCRIERPLQRVWDAEGHCWRLTVAEWPPWLLAMNHQLERGRGHDVGRGAVAASEAGAAVERLEGEDQGVGDDAGGGQPAGGSEDAT